MQCPRCKRDMIDQGSFYLCGSPCQMLYRPNQLWSVRLYDGQEHYQITWALIGTTTDKTRVNSPDRKITMIPKQPFDVDVSIIKRYLRLKAFL